MKIFDFRKDQDLENNIAEIHFHRNAYWDLHGHTYWELVIMIEGQSLHRIIDAENNRHEYVMSANDYCFLSPEYCHQFANIDSIKSHQITLSATTEFVKNTLDLLDPTLFQQIQSSKEFIIGKLTNEQLQYFVQNTNEMLIAKKNNSKLKEVIPKMAFLEFANILAGNILTPKNDFPPWFNDLLDKISKVDNFVLSTVEICKLCGYSHRQLLRIFQNYLHMTINEYMIDVKLNYCCALLASTNYTTLDICNRLNFSSLSHLNKLFREKYHTTPSQYRKDRKTTI